MATKQIDRLRALMAKRGIDAFFAPDSDFHASEYVGEFFKVRQYLSGFSGSAGTLVVTADKAGLWTDARFLLRAEQVLKGTGIDLYPMGQADTLEISAYLDRVLPEHGVVSVDGRTVSAAWGKELQRVLGDQRVLWFSEDLAGEIWEDRPSLPKNQAYLLKDRYTGQKAADKISWLRAEMKALNADVHLISALDQIAWLLNIRGSDVANNPVVLSYLIVEQKRFILFVDQNKIGPEVGAYLAGLGGEIRPYEAVYHDLEAYCGKQVLLDPKRTNYTLYRILKGRAGLVERDSPVLHAKARKNLVEQENLRQAHIKDGLAVTRSIHWLKTANLSRGNVTERQAAEHVDRMRAEQPGCVGRSFGTIAAYGRHGADIHYQITPESNIPLEPRGFILIDSGGQYYEGTTDVTRTVALGPLTDNERKHFTLVLQGMLDLSQAVFPQGCRGYHLDALARAPLWKQGIDFGHGTGHGIGYMLCVHEPPVGFHWRSTRRYDTEILCPGMVISDEPGVYIRDSHGIRLENQLLCCESGMSGFLSFETLTLAPIDLDAVDLTWLDEKGRSHLNAYHRRVYETLSPYLTREERVWLENATRPV